MAKTKSLNDDDSVWVTTFYGGQDKGRCYAFTAVKNGVRAEKVFTEDEFLATLTDPEVGLVIDNGIRPEFDG